MKKQFITPAESFEPFTKESTDQTIPDRLEYIADRFPEKTAISTRDGQYSYKQIDATANGIARALLQLGNKTSSPLAVMLEQGAPQIIASMGVMKAGMFYVPLDPFNPTPRNQHMLEDSGANILLTNDANLRSAQEIADLGQMIFNVDRIAVDLNAAKPDIDIAPSSLAYVLYTSGSTGKPKGIMQSHRNVLHNVMRHTNSYCITPHDRQTLLYTSSVYGGQRDTYNALLNGASLHVYVVKKEGIAGLEKWIESNGISIYCSVATIFRQLVNVLTGNYDFNAVRLIKLGGEATFKRDVDAYKKFFLPTCIMHCGLSSTETGLARNYFIAKSTVVEKPTVPLGYPEDDLEVLLLDEFGKPLQNSGIGEIAVRSKYISLGYWNDPELTSQYFLTDSNDPAVRIYKTGDMGELYPDGLLEHRGRKDSQIKIRGNRIEVAEIDMALVKQENIKETVIVGCKDHQGIDKLVAYVVTKDKTEPDVKELRKALLAKLPEYMVPSYFIGLLELPLLPNGKIDRKSLPNPFSQELWSKAPYVEADDYLEKKLIEIWAQILNIPRIGAKDNFFELGGDSLSAVLMLAEIEKQLGTGLPTNVLAEEPTIEKLARALKGNVSHIDWPIVVPIKESGSNPPLFCVHGVFGSTLFSRSLGAFLDKEQPLYALQSKRLDGKYFNYKNIQDIAASYIEHVRRVQPEGPYYLSGFSFGGLVAFEMARQLQKQGQAVGLLFIFDSNSPTIDQNPKTSLMRSIIDMPTEILDHSAKAMLLQRKRGVRTSLRVWTNKFRSASKYAKYLILHFYLKLGSSLPVILRDDYLAWNHYRIGNNYRTSPCETDIVLFVSKNKEKRSVVGWRKATTMKVASYPVQSEHWNLFNEPHISWIAGNTSRIIKEHISVGS